MTFPSTLTHASGRPLAIDRTRLLLAGAPTGRPAGFERMLAKLDLELEDAGPGKPKKGVNQTPRFCFVRSVGGSVIAPAVPDELTATLGKKGKGRAPRLSWVGPVYRFASDPSDHGLMGVVLDTLVVTPHRPLPADIERRLNAHSKKLALNELARRKKAAGPTRVFTLANLRATNAIAASLALVESLGGSAAAHPSYIPLLSPACATPTSETFWGSGLTGQWNMRAIGAEAAWDITKGDPTVYVCVLDQGIERAHEELNRASSYGFEPVTPSESSGFVPPSSDPSATPGLSAHGTAIASITSGIWDLYGVAGLAGEASLFALAAPNWASTEIEDAIIRASNLATPTVRDKRVLLIGGASNVLDTPGVRAAIDGAIAAGLVVVCASGNADSSTIPYPGDGTHPGLIVCGSTDQADGRYLSNFGATLSVVAPGKDIPVAQPGNTYFSTFEGSSSGAAHVAGLAALMLSNGALDFTSYPPAAASRAEKIRNVIERTAEKVGGTYNTDINPRSTELGFGRIRADWALDFADVMIRDDPTDTGEEPSTGVFWRDSDIVIRRINELQADVEANFDTWHAAPPESTQIYSNADGSSCFGYVRVRNLGPAVARNVRVRAVGAAAATGFMYPTDWNAADDANHFVMSPLPWPGDPAAVGDEYVVGTLSAGQSKIVRFEITKAKADKGLAWPGSHVCGLAKVTADNDYAFTLFSPVTPVSGQQSRRNNLCQRNLHVVTATSPWFFPFLAGSAADADEEMEIEIHAARLPAGTLMRLGLDDPERAAPRLDLAAMQKSAPRAEHLAAAGPVTTHFALLDPARLAVSYEGSLAGVLTLAAGTRFESATGKRAALAVDGGRLTVQQGKRVVETSAKQTKVRVPKAPGKILPLYLEIPVPPNTAKTERFFVDIIQRNAAGEVVGGVSLFLIP